VGRIVRRRHRHRYIGFRITFTGDIPSFMPSDFIQALRKEARDFFSKDGDNLRIWLIQFDGTSGIIKCPSQEKDCLIHFLQSLKKIGGASVDITTVSTSGTIRGLTKKR
jgi:RNase P/RNase MRP subunit POP5